MTIYNKNILKKTNTYDFNKLQTFYKKAAKA